MFRIITFKLLLLGLLLFVIFACSHNNNYQLTKALQATESKHYGQAIEYYQKHIKIRLKEKDRPKWENPYIYYLDIGDLYLMQKDPNSALTYYLDADEKKVEAGYVNDRLRFLAEYYYKNNEKQKAIEHLKKYKNRDPLIFGLMLNRIAQQIVAEETAAVEINQLGKITNSE